MAGNNLAIRNTGLDHCYINGIPIVEAEINISDVYKEVARISSLATNADPYFFKMPKAAKIFSELHGEGDRITRDFLDEGAREILPIFNPFQRLIPEGAFDAKPVEYEYLGNTADSTWNNPDPSTIYIDAVKIRSTAGSGDVTFIVDGVTLGTVSLPQLGVVSEYLSYDLAGYLGGYMSIANYDHVENIRNNNVAQEIQLVVTNASVDFEYDYKVCGSKYDAIGWIKALTEVGDVKLPSVNDNIRISYLVGEFTWVNNNFVTVTGVTLKHNAGSADVIIRYNETDSVSRFFDSNTIGEDFFNLGEDISQIAILIENASDDFCYDMVINTVVPSTIPSPRFEFDSLWNPGKIIYRYQNMDNRNEDQKLNYTSETLRNTRIDPNVFDDVVKFLKDSLKNYVLKELYLAIGYDKKANEYTRKYEMSRRDAKFWVRSEKGLLTQYMFGGV